MKNRNYKIIMILLFIGVLGIIFNNYKDSLIIDSNFENEIKYKIKNQWALSNTGQLIENERGKEGIDINAIEAWEITKGSKEVIIGVLDTGIDISNDKISNNIYVNKDEIPNNGIDDDDNGFIDDINGWDFYNDDNSVYDDYLSDYHGTFITSLIVGSHDDSEVWGVAPNVTILPLKFMRGSSGDIDDAIEAIEYAYDNELYETMKKYKDVLFICSSGKGYNNLKETPVYPASFDLENVICVSAVNNQGNMYEYSGYGLEDIVVAPGEDILGVLPEGDYLYSDGTSFATAYVTGVAALIKSYKKDIVTDDLAKILKSSKKNMNELSGKLSHNGMIDAKLSIENASKIK